MSSVDILESEELLKGRNKKLEEISSTVSSCYSSSSASDGDDEVNDDGIIMIDLPSTESQLSTQIFNISSTPPTEGPSPTRYGEALKKYFTSRHKYEVFLSFRGADTRKAFTDHLYAALVGAGIHTFRDECDLEKGENIKSELHKAIQESMIAIIVFSKEYAYSEWCLDELVRILERKNATGLKVLPVFYDMQPSQIRNQSRNLGNVFSKTEQMDKVMGWKIALKEVADLGGMVLQNEYDGHESKFIQEIVAHVKSKMDGAASNGLTCKKMQHYISLIFVFVFFVFFFYFGYPAFVSLIDFRKRWGNGEFH